MPLVSSLLFSLLVGTSLIATGATPVSEDDAIAADDHNLVTGEGCSQADQAGFFLQLASVAIGGVKEEDYKDMQEEEQEDEQDEEQDQEDLAAMEEQEDEEEEEEDFRLSPNANESEAEDDDQKQKTNIKPWNCRKQGGSIEVLGQTGEWAMGYTVGKLNKNGKLKELFRLPFGYTSPPYKYLNAIGLNPKDNIPYGCILLDEFPSSFYIVRFDKTGFEFVAKMEGDYDPVAGTFDSNGNYYFMHKPNGSHNPVLYNAGKMHNKKGYAAQGNKNLPTLELDGLILWKYRSFGDIVAYKQGNQEYIMAINLEKQAVMVKWNAGEPQKSKVTSFTTNDPFPRLTAYMNYGAAWNHRGRVFFSSNDGFGVVEITNINTNSATITLRKVAKSEKTENNDGFNCNSAAPFK